MPMMKPPANQCSRDNLGRLTSQIAMTENAIGNASETAVMPRSYAIGMGSS